MTAPPPDPPQPRPDDVPAGYEPVGPLGRGAFGEVLAARDADGRTVALKVMAKEAASRSEAVWQFLGEHRRLARLAHPAFPRALDAGVLADGRPYYAMTLAPGDEPRGPLPAARVRAIVAAVADALAHLHATGWAHGDLKPENLRVTSDDAVMILDVGLMAPLGRRREAVAGTLEYLAPEAFRLVPLDVRVDLYALGATAFALWTGGPPFRPDPPSQVELVRQQLTAAPPAPPAAATDPELAALIAALLAKDPARRPSSARAVLAALGRASGDEAAFGGLLGGDFIGRDALLAAWERALAAPARACWLSFTGAPGEGKSRTLDELRARALAAGRHWVGTGAGRGAGVPGAAVRTLVRQALALAGRPPAPATAAWLGEGGSAPLAELDGPARQVAMRAAAAADLAAAAAALAAAGRPGLACGLDDWHLADEADLAFLALARGAEPPPPIAWAVALAPEAPDAAALAEVGDQLALGPLAPDELAALVEARLGAAAPPPLCDRLAELSRGNPALLDLTLEHMVASGVLRGEADGWALSTGDAAAALPQGLAAVWRARLAELPAAARRLAGVLAVAAPAGALPAPWLGAALGLADEPLAGALEALQAAGLAVVADGRARLVAAIGEAAEGVLPADRRRWSEALVQRLASGDAAPPPSGRSAQDLGGEILAAARLALAADLPVAGPLAAEAGRRALAAGAPREALTLLMAALERSLAGAPAAERLAVMLPLADALRFADRTDEAAERFEAAAELAAAVPEPAAEARARTGLAKCRQVRGAYAEAQAAYEAADAAAARAGDHVQRARASVALARMLLMRGEAAAADAWCSAAEREAVLAGSLVMRAQAGVLRGLMVVMGDPGRGDEAGAILGEALASARAAGDRVTEGQALDALGNARLAVGDLVGASEAFRAFGALARGHADASEALMADLNLALAEAERGELAAAAGLAAEVGRRAAAVGRRYVQGCALVAEAQARWRSGDVEAAHGCLAHAEEIVAALGNALLEELVRLQAAELAVVTGDLAAADAALARLAELADKTHNAEAVLRAGALAGERALLAGEPAEAAERARPIADSANRVAAHHAWRVLARAALAAGDPAEAGRAAEAARALAEAWRSDWHLAADLVLVARAAEAAGSPEVRTLAERALSAARSGDGNPWAAAEAAALLTRIGAPPASVAGLIDPADLAIVLEDLALATDEPAIGEVALRGAMALIGAERGYMLAYEAGRLRRAVTCGMAPEGEPSDGFSASIAGRALFTGRPIYVADAVLDPSWREAASVMALELRTVVALPVGVPDRMLGVLYMDRADPEPALAPADLGLLQLLATAAASAVFRAREVAGARAEAARMRACAELGLRLVATPPAERRAALLAAVREAVGAERASWLRREAAGAWRPSESALEFGAVSLGVVDHVAATGEPLAVLDVAAAEEWRERASVQALGLRTVWALPAGADVVYLDAARVDEADPTEALPLAQALVAYGTGFLAD